MRAAGLFVPMEPAKHERGDRDADGSSDQKYHAALLTVSADSDNFDSAASIAVFSGRA
jgi:hypothetical protein